MKIRSHSESHLVELDDGSRWQIFPGDLDLTLNWKPETDLAVVPIDDQVSSHALIGEGGHRECALVIRISPFASPKSNVVGSPARLRNNDGAQGRW